VKFIVIFLVELLIGVVGQGVPRQEDVRDVLAQRTLEGREIESKDLPRVSFVLVTFLGCQEGQETLLVGEMAAPRENRPCSVGEVKAIYIPQGFHRVEGRFKYACSFFPFFH
jgi:hypothetical protein